MSNVVRAAILLAVLAVPLCYYRRRILSRARRGAGPASDDDLGSLAGIRVEVYGKRDCGLCDEVKATLLRVRRDVPFDFHEIDIESSPELYEAYSDRVPLVAIDGRPAFKFRVDEQALRRRLARESDRLRGGATRGSIG